MSDIADQKKLCNSLKELLAESMLFGMQVAGVDSGSSIFDEKNKKLLQQIKAMNKQANVFIEDLKMDEVLVEDIMPLYQEIVQQIKSEGDSCVYI